MIGNAPVSSDSDHWSRRYAWQSLVWVLGTFAGVAGLWVVTGVGLREAAVLLAAVTLQTVSGSVCWLLLVRGRTNLPEIVGAGMAIGVIAAIGGAQAGRVFGLGPWSWSIPMLASSGVFLVGSWRRGIVSRWSDREVLSQRDVLGILAAVMLGVVVLAMYLVLTPLSWLGYRAFDPDTLFHEGLAHSVHLFGPNEFILAAGEQLRYHWFAHAWIGALDEWVRPGPLVVVSRVAPVVALVGTVLIGWAWARRMSTTWWVPALAASLLAGSACVGIRGGVWGGDHLARGGSPSQSFSTPWLLLFALLLTVLMQGRSSRWLGFPLFSIVAFALVGGKVSHAAVVGGGLAAFAVLARPSPTLTRSRIVGVAMSGFVGLALGYLIVIAGGTGGLELGFERTAASVVGLELWPSGWPMPAIGVVVGAGALLASITPRWAGLFGLVYSDRSYLRSPEGSLGIGILGSALLLTLFTTQPGGSQLYFALSASVLLTVLSAVGLGQMSDSANHSEKSHISFTRTPSVFLAGGVGAIVAVGVFEAVTYLGWSFKPLFAVRPMSPVLAWMVILGLVVRSLRHYGVRSRSQPAVLPLMVASLMAASLAAMPIQQMLLIANLIPRGLSVEEEIGWHVDHFAAGGWVRENSSASDVVVTNRFCTDAREPMGCRSLSFITAASSGRKLWIEGSEYIGTKDPTLVPERTALSKRFTAAPTLGDFETLWSSGVRWVWLDCQVDCSASFEGFGRTAFVNEHVKIIELTNGQ